MACSVANANSVAPGSLTPMPENMSFMDGPMTQVQMKASIADIKKATNITMSG